MLLRKKRNKYWINARWTLGLKNKIFIVFLIGRDQRVQNPSVEIDPKSEQRKAPAAPELVLFYTGLFFWTLLSVFCVSFVFMYLLKSALGINLVSGSSPFPNFLKMIGLCHAICH
jgi:hypothetical protein